MPVWLIWGVGTFAVVTAIAFVAIGLGAYGNFFRHPLAILKQALPFGAFCGIAAALIAAYLAT